MADIGFTIEDLSTVAPATIYFVKHSCPLMKWKKGAP